MLGIPDIPVTTENSESPGERGQSGVPCERGWRELGPGEGNTEVRPGAASLSDSRQAESPGPLQTTASSRQDGSRSRTS